MKRFVLAPAVAALVMFVFGAIYWMNPLPYRSFNHVADDAAAIAALDTLFPATGVYMLPGMYLDSKVREGLAEKGPIAEVHFVKHGVRMMDAGVMVMGFVQEFVLCLILVGLLNVTGSIAAGRRHVVNACLTIGALLAVYELGDAIWSYHSWAWQATRALYSWVALGLVGLVLAKMLVPKAAPVQRAPVDTAVGV